MEEALEKKLEVCPRIILVLCKLIGSLRSQYLSYSKSYRGGLELASDDSLDWESFCYPS